MTHPIVEQIRKADNAIVAEDFDTLLDIYTDDAILVIEPGKNAKGKAAIRKAFEAISVYFKNGLQVKQQGLEVLEALQYTNVGQGILAGIAILFCALILDKIVQGKKD